MNPINLQQKGHIGELVTAGDYCICANGLHGGKAVILRCPFCAQIMACSHQVLNENPLSLNPSIVGPHGLCSDHFFITNGIATK